MKKTTMYFICLMIPFFGISQEVFHKKMYDYVNSKKGKAESFEKYQLFNSSSIRGSEQHRNAVRDGIVLDFNEAFVSELFQQDPKSMALEVPLKNTGSMITLELIQKDVFSDDFRVTTSGGVDITDQLDRGKHYRGVIQNNPNSLVSLSIFKNEVSGFIASQEGTYTLGKIQDSEKEHIIYKNSDLKKNFEFECSTEDDGIGYTETELEMPAASRDPGDCVNVYIEAGKSVYDAFGGDISDTMNFLVGVFAQSYVLYANDGMTLQTSEMFIWTTPDPYNGPSAGNYRAQFQNNTAQGAFNGDIGHLVEVDNVGGQAAGFSGLCNADTDQSLCMSGFSGTNFNNVPTPSFNVQLITHEMGHLLGSRHTHACVWNGNNTAIDTCSGFTEGGCPLVGSPPPPGGTIMSYCFNSVGMDFNEGFHPQPTAVMLNNINAVGNCLTNCAPPSPNDFCADALPIDYGDTLSGNTDLATIDSGTPFCGTAISAPGVWYRFTGNGSQTRLSTCNQANYDTKISIFSGGCNVLNCEGGNDDALGCASFSSEIDICTTAGEEYLVLVHGFAQATGDFDLTLTDIGTPPAITCPSDITVDNDPDECGAIVSFLATSTDECPGVTISYSQDPDTLFPVGTTTVTATATDAAGNTATCNFDVTVNDTEAPTIDCPSDITQNTDLGECGAVVTYFEPTVTDNCSGDGVLMNGSFETGDFTGWTVIDFPQPFIAYYVGTGNTGNGFFPEATPTDGNLMAANGFDSNTAGATSLLYQEINIPTGASVAELSWDENIDYDLSTFCTGCSTRIYEVQVLDLTNNVLEVLHSITALPNTIDNDNVWNNEERDLSAYAGQTIRIGFWQRTPDAFSGPAKFALDNVSLDLKSVVQTTGLSSGSVFPVGTTTNTFEVTDSSGNTATCSFDVKVDDTEAPVIACAMDVEASTNPDSCFATVNFNAPLVVDNCGAGDVTITQTVGMPSGSLFPVGVSQIAYDVTDANGNTSQCSFTITVTDDTAPVAACQDITVELDATGSVTITPSQLNGGSTDNCNLDTSMNSIDIDTFGCADVGDNTVTLTVSDSSGNTSTCTATVTVVDSTAPMVACSDITVALGADGTVTLDPMMLDGGSTDACGIATLTADPAVLDCGDLGVTEVTLTATDVNGNSSSCTALVTVEDNIAPTLVCQEAVIELGPDGTATIDPVQLLDLSQPLDNCGIQPLVTDITEVDCDDVGSEVTVTVTAMDASGNTSSCTTTITVVDVSGPVFDQASLPVGPIVRTINPATGIYRLEDFTVGVSATDGCSEFRRPIAVSQSPFAGTELDEGTYDITITAMDEAGNDTDHVFELQVQPALGVGDVDLSSLALYPNPASDRITLSNPNGMQLERAAIYDIQGRLVKEIDLTAMPLERSLDVSQLQAATYMFIITGENGKTIRQIIKE